MTPGGFWFHGGRVSLDLIGTAGTTRGELLASPGDLAAWLAAAGLADPPVRVSAADLDATLALRAALARLVNAAMTDAGHRLDDVGLVNAAAARPAPTRRLLVLDGDLVARAAPPAPADCLGTIARDAVDLLAGSERGLLRECAGPDCSGIYVDRSRGRRRRWCTSAGCGNRARVAAHRDRRRAQDAPEGRDPS